MSTGCVCLGKRAHSWVWQGRVLRRGSLEARAYRSGVGTQVSWGRKDNSFVCCVSLTPSPMHRCVGCKRSLLHQWTHGLMQIGMDTCGLNGVDSRSLLCGPSELRSQHSGFGRGLISLGVTPRTNTVRAAIFPPRGAWGLQRPFWEAKGGPLGQGHGVLRSSRILTPHGSFPAWSPCGEHLGPGSLLSLHSLPPCTHHQMREHPAPLSRYLGFRGWGPAVADPVISCSNQAPRRAAADTRASAFSASHLGSVAHTMRPILPCPVSTACQTPPRPPPGGNRSRGAQGGF